MAASDTATFTPHVREKRARRRREILHAALQAVRERGYHATTLEDIAERLGIRKTALYHYFPDKDAIFHACHMESLAELDRILEEAAACCEDPAEQLRFVIREHVRVMTDTMEGSPLSFEVPSLPEPMRSEVIRRRDRYEAALRRIVSEGIAQGTFKEVDPKTAVFAILGAINWVSRWFRPDGEVSGPELGDRFADYFLKGLCT